MIDVTVTVVFHREGAYALPALSSMKTLVDRARADGLRVEARAIMDKPDATTLRLVNQAGSWLDDIEEVACGDLGLSRNAGIKSASGQFLAFLDGDDLWGEEWLVRAYRAATRADAPETAVWHPESLYYFYASDYDRHSITEHQNPASQSFHFFHRASTDPDFDRNALLLENVWSANVFASKATHLKYPYTAIDKNTGFGIEDWSWNVETVWDGVPHLVVKDTVHLIRVKDSGSLGQQNAVEGLLPHFPEGISPRFEYSKRNKNAANVRAQ